MTGGSVRNVLVLMVLLATSLFVTACAREEATQTEPQMAEPAPPPASGHAGVVLETMDAGNYTYVRVDVGGEEIWAAGPRVEVAVGDRVVMTPGNPMKDFYSPSMDRTFEMIYFVGEILLEGEMQAASQMPPGHPPIGQEQVSSAVSETDISGMEKVADGFTIAEIFSQRAELAGQPVKVRGKVVKFNGGILGTNWLHIQDGSGSASDGTNDLTVTSNVVAEPGQTVVVVGMLELDKDFGAGYRYEVIVTDAQVTSE